MVEIVKNIGVKMAALSRNRRAFIIIAVVLVTLLMVALSSLVVLDVRSSEGIFYSGDSSTSLPQRTAKRPPQARRDDRAGAVPTPALDKARGHRGIIPALTTPTKDSPRASGSTDR